MILLPMLVVTFLGFRTYSVNLQKKASAFSLELLSQLGKNVDHYFVELDRISMTFLMDSGVESALKAENGTPLDRYRDKQLIDKALMNIVLIPFQDVIGSYLIKPDGEIYSRYGSGRQADYSGYRDEPWYAEALQAEGKGVLLSTFPMRSVDGREELAFSFLRSVVDVEKNESIGLFRMDIGLQGLKEIFANVKGETGQELLIVDAAGRIVYDRNEEEITRQFPFPLEGSFGSAVKSIDGREVLINYVAASRSGWKVANVIPIDELTEGTEIIRNLLWAVTAVAVLLSFVLILFLTRRLLLPLKKMQALMRKVEGGDYSVQFKARSNDEIGKLAGSFNHMVHKINELVHHVFAIRILKREADYKVLQSRINPHFLYNTLESISMKAEVDRNYEVAEMIARLGRLFRMTINHDRETILMAKEMEYVEHYVKLQSIRFKGLEFTVDIAPEVMTSYVLPWIVQPLVENAIVHGLSPVNHEGRIRIVGAMENGEIVIRVSDNGVGLDPAKERDIRALLLSDADKRDEEMHIGLKNISDRIRYRFGDSYGLTIGSKTGEGTTAEIRMPGIKEEGMPSAESIRGR